jgi:hypothetical protein
MNHRTAIAITSPIAALVLLRLAAGCGSTATNASIPGLPPARPAGPTAQAGEPRTFAINSVQMGKDAVWKQLGYNLDGKTSAKGAKDVCKPAANAPQGLHADGNDGRDNAFGQFIVPLLLQASAGAEDSLNQALAGGTFTIMVQATGLPADGQSATNIQASVWPGAENSGDPTRFTKAADWPITPALLTDGTTIAGGSKVRFTSAYTANGIFVSSTSSDNKTIALDLNISGQPLNLVIQRAILTHRVVGATATDGVIAGVIRTSDLVDSVKKIAPQLSPLACSDAILSSIVDVVTGAADVRIDGSVDPALGCDAVSIGLGFTAKEVGNPKRIQPPQPERPDPCTPGGAPTDAGRD